MYIEKLQAETGLTFDDILLIPAASEVEPDQADVTTRFSRNYIFEYSSRQCGNGYRQYLIHGGGSCTGRRDYGYPPEHDP
jgi:hypothetical protein